MSGLTNSAAPRSAVPLLAWAALGLATAAVVVILILAITSEGDAGIAAPAPPLTAPGARYDGGPEEGTRGPSARPPIRSSAPAIRYDGGPEEGTRGPAAR